MSFGSSFPRPIVVKGHALVAGFSFGPMLALANGLSVLNQATKRKSYLSENCFLVFPQKKIGTNGTKVLQARTSGNPQRITVGTQQK